MKATLNRCISRTDLKLSRDDAFLISASNLFHKNHHMTWAETLTPAVVSDWMTCPMCLVLLVNTFVLSFFLPCIYSYLFVSYNLSVCWAIPLCLSVCLSVCLSICISIYLSIYLSIYFMSVYLSLSIKFL